MIISQCHDQCIVLINLLISPFLKIFFGSNTIIILYNLWVKTLSLQVEYNTNLYDTVSVEKQIKSNIKYELSPYHIYQLIKNVIKLVLVII